MLGIIASFDDGSAIIEKNQVPNMAPDAAWIDAQGAFDLATDFEPEVEHYDKPSQSTFLHGIRPDAVPIPSWRNDYPSLVDVRLWESPFWEGQITQQDDNLGGNHTYVDNPMLGSGQYDYPGMMPIDSYKVVTRRGNPISYTDFVDQEELYA
jgi:hypothetical protein